MFEPCAKSTQTPAPFRQICSTTPGKTTPNACLAPARCVSDFLKTRALQVSGFTAIQTPTQQLAITLQLSAPKGGNCHGYTAQKLPLLYGVVGANDYLEPFPICGVSPATVLIFGATRLIAGDLPQEPIAFDKALDALAPHSGDILIWEDDDTETLAHSTTIIGRVDGGWLVDDKMGNQPARKTWATTVALELYRPSMPACDEEEFHPERMPTHYRVMVRRPK